MKRGTAGSSARRRRDVSGGDTRGGERHLECAGREGSARRRGLRRRRIDHVSAQACVDASHIYATGFSGGARMSSLLGCGLGARLAAIAPVSGLRAPAATCPARPIPVITFHGLADPENPYEGHVPGRAAWVESGPDALRDWAAHNKCKEKVVLEDPPGPLSTMRTRAAARAPRSVLFALTASATAGPMTKSIRQA